MSIEGFVKSQQAELARLKQDLQSRSPRDQKAIGKVIRKIEHAIYLATRKGLRE